MSARSETGAGSTGRHAAGLFAAVAINRDSNGNALHAPVLVLNASYEPINVCAARRAGRTKYSPLRLLKLASDGIFAFSIVPLRAAAIFGATATGLSVLYAIYSLYVKFWLHAPQGFTALVLAITFLSGVNLFFLGIIGEYVGRVYEEAKGRPHYVVRKVVRQRGLGSRAATPRTEIAEVLERTGTDYDWK